MCEHKIYFHILNIIIFDNNYVSFWFPDHWIPSFFFRLSGNRSNSAENIECRDILCISLQWMSLFLNKYASVLSVALITLLQLNILHHVFIVFFLFNHLVIQFAVYIYKLVFKVFKVRCSATHKG